MRLAGWICLFVFTLATAAAEERYKLRPKLIPAVGYATVTISGVNHPYHDQKQIAGKRFQFRGLPKGTYTVVVTHPRWGETRRTIAVTEGTADESGRVEALIAIRRSDEGRSRHLEERSTVSVRELKIPDRAIELRGDLVALALGAAGQHYF